MQTGEGTLVDLVLAARAGDDTAWRGLVARFDGMVRAVAAACRLQDSDVADAVQTSWLNAYEQIGSLREPERFGGWLRAIARNASVDICLRAGRERPADDLGVAVADPGLGPEALALRTEVVRDVRAAVATLPLRNRLIVECLFFAGAAYATVAGETGMPSGGIGPTRARTLARLRRQLGRRGHGPDRALATTR